MEGGGTEKQNMRTARRQGSRVMNDNVHFAEQTARFACPWSPTPSLGRPYILLVREDGEVSAAHSLRSTTRYSALTLESLKAEPLHLAREHG